MPWGGIYQKGANFERELVGLFWESGWTAMRAAGSGTTKHPVPDVIAVKDGRVILVECKTTTKDRLSLKQAVSGIKEFAKKSGGSAYLAIKFYKQKPRFYDICELIIADRYTITDKDEYLSFEQLIGAQAKL
jgi:Holliday junction resolvase